MTDLSHFARCMDHCWIEGRFDDLGSYLAEDVVMVAPDGAQRIEGLGAAVESYREFVSRSRIGRFETGAYVVTERGDAAVVEYRWDMAWECEGISHSAGGREILVLSRRDREWRVVWRTQLADDRPGS